MFSTIIVLKHSCCLSTHVQIVNPMTSPDPYFSSATMRYYAWNMFDVYTVCMNATLNPAVYFIRNKRFRKKILSRFNKIKVDDIISCLNNDNTVTRQTAMFRGSIPNYHLTDPQLIVLWQETAYKRSLFSYLMFRYNGLMIASEGASSYYYQDRISLGLL